ncbi:SDR family NAD(P)-dependent oxidoreductase [Lentisphaerota bacterium ZTH]|nr:SDR family oxidoreductase [Lentisphaerota bacterium]WET05333.1 SDR family NAD(P)-dependent oxidoreductase [Lentisphaerota bacterium ZTH]
MNRFEGKNIVITGASSGIGLAVCHRIAAEGGNIALVDINEKGLEKAQRELGRYCTKTRYFKCDVSREDEVAATADSIVREFKSIHALSHNVGILKTYNTHEMTLDQFNEIVAVNLNGTFLINKHFIPVLIKNEQSYLVNMSSIAEFHPHPWMSAYSATKGAVKSFTRSISLEYHKQGLRANCICPGSIKTGLAEEFSIPQGADASLTKYLTPFGKPHMVSPEKIAGAIAMLCSEDAFHMNGTELIVDGGRI